MARRFPKLIYDLVCDDIRQELGNKSSFIGIYRSKIIILPIPSVLPKLCFHLAFTNIRHGDVFRFEFLDPDNKIIINAKPQTLSLPQERKFRLCLLDMIFSGINIKKEGVYRLVSIFGEEEKAKQEVKIEMKKGR